MTARPTKASASEPCDVAIVGNDMLLRALPARPVQVSHAVAALGYQVVLPASWGDELIAEYTIRGSMAHDPGPRVMCACPRVRDRLLAAGDELLPHLVSLVAPPVALARYLRAMAPARPLHITYIGACEGALPPDIDVRISPQDFLQQLESRGIILSRQPTVFRDVIPPDRRRYWSLPGGCPAEDVARAQGSGADIRQLERDDFALDVAECLLAGTPVLVDVATAVQCSCAGAITLHGARTARDAVVAMEPPRSSNPVVEPDVDLDLEFEHRRVLTLSRVETRVEELPPSTPAALAAPVTEVAQVVGPIPAGTLISSGEAKRSIAVTPPGIAAMARRESKPRSTPSAGAAAPRMSAPRYLPPRLFVASAGRPSAATNVTPAPTPPTTTPPSESAKRPGAPPAFVFLRYGRGAHARRLRPTEGTPVPRAYAALRPHGAASDTIPPAPETALREPESPGASGPDIAPSLQATGGESIPMTADGATEPLPVAPAALALDENPAILPETVHAAAHEIGSADPPQLQPSMPIETAFVAPPHEVRGRDQAATPSSARLRPLTPPARANPRRLWGLLASVVLIVAVFLILAVMMGGAPPVFAP